MTQVEFGVLGPLEVRLAGTTIAVPAGRQRALLGVLLLAPRHIVPVGRLIAALWGDPPPEGARRALHTAVGRLRQTLAPAGVRIDYREPGYVLQTPPGSRDSDRFEAMVRSARDRLDTDPAAALAGFSEALSLWRGPAWLDLADGLAVGEAARLEELRQEAVEDRAAALIAVGRVGEGLGAFEAAVAATPLRERPVAALMRALARHGRTADALAAFSRHRRLLAAELGLDPSADLARLHGQILRGEPAVTVPPDSARADAKTADAAGADATPPPLPASVASFIGRDRDLAALRSLLADHRLVTVAGPGGVGKTRLVNEAARAAAMPVWWVDLEPVTDAAGVDRAVADVFGVVPGRGTPLGSAVRTRVAAASGLLVLDGCEHLVTPVATLVHDLVSAGRGPVVVVTSRERLGLDGERVLPIGPLDLPPADVADPTAPAVVLFLDRARSVVPDLVADTAVLRRVGEVCRALDGLPLAIELAAARAGALSVDDLADRLAARFELLAGGRRGGPDRHRTLWSVVDWSYRLLTQPERTVLARLAGFAGEFDLASAEHVAAGPDAPATRVADLVARLVDRSMLARPGVAGPARYRMLETIRHYVFASLDGEDREDVRRRHAEWCLELAEHLGGGTIGPAEAACAQRLTAALPDLRAAWQWVRAAGRWDIGARLIAALWPWAQWRARTDVLGWGREVLDAAPEHPLAPVAAAAASRAAWTHAAMAEARALAERGVSAAREPLAAAEPMEALGDTALILGDPLAGASAYAEAARRYDRRGLPVAAAIARGNEVLALLYGGRDPAAALAILRDAARDSDNPTLRAWAGYCAAEADQRPDPGPALAAYEDAMSLADSVGNTLIASFARVGGAALLGRHGTDEVHAQTFRDLIAELWRTGDRTVLVTALRNLAIFLARRRDDRAAVELAAALEQQSTVNPSYGAEARRLERALDGIRHRMGGEQYARAWRAGQDRDLDEATRAVLGLPAGAR